MNMADRIQYLKGNQKEYHKRNLRIKLSFKRQAVFQMGK